MCPELEFGETDRISFGWRNAQPKTEKKRRKVGRCCAMCERANVLLFEGLVFTNETCLMRQSPKLGRNRDALGVN